MSKNVFDLRVRDKSIIDTVVCPPVKFNRTVSLQILARIASLIIKCYKVFPVQVEYSSETE